MVKKKGWQFKDPYNRIDLEITLAPIENLEVISHQRKPSNYHIKHLSSSIERVGFIVPLVVVRKEESEDEYIIIDGQHRFLAAKELGIKELPVIIVPKNLAKLMMNLNIEKELNIREKSFVAFQVYQEYLGIKPELLESDPEIIDSIEQAYYVTLGIGYETDEKLSGSSFESILKKSDFFLEVKLTEAFEIRKKRAEKLLQANALVKNIAQKIKELGSWHPYIYQQIVSWANPYKRKRLPTDFDSLFGEIIENLQKAQQDPCLVLQHLQEEVE